MDKVVSVDDAASVMCVLCCLPPSDLSNPLAVANFESNKSLPANTYGYGNNPEFHSSSATQMEGQFSDDNEASSTIDCSSNPPAVANFDRNKTSTTNAIGNGDQ